ncbi:MAG: histidine phosphatase family protein [Rhodoferax sp.]|nr:histidine phosphatase family protein [Rhodoferax sp.]
MDLILWRHADAEESIEGDIDLARVLTPRGLKQALRMSGWLDRQLPDATRILCSPARRCEQTAHALGRKFKIRAELAPGCSVEQLLEAAQWPGSKQAVLVIGHQPVLGETIARLLPFKFEACPVRKGAVWWLRTRERDGEQQTVVTAVQSPDTL